VPAFLRELEEALGEAPIREERVAAALVPAQPQPEQAPRAAVPQLVEPARAPEGPAQVVR
jgi:hypothetical protein